MKPLPKILFFIFQHGEMDCVEFTIEKARELAMDPDPPYDKRPYKIERWKFKEDRYIFDSLIQADHL